MSPDSNIISVSNDLFFICFVSGSVIGLLPDDDIFEFRANFASCCFNHDLSFVRFMAVAANSMNRIGSLNMLVVI